MVWIPEPLHEPHHQGYSGTVELFSDPLAPSPPHSAPRPHFLFPFHLSPSFTLGHHSTSLFLPWGRLGFVQTSGAPQVFDCDSLAMTGMQPSNLSGQTFSLHPWPLGLQSEGRLLKSSVTPDRCPKIHSLGIMLSDWEQMWYTVSSKDMMNRC